MTSAVGAPPLARSVIVLPADPEAMRIGGIASFVRSFVRFAPDELDVAMIGISSHRPLGTWSDVEFEGRTLRFFPVVRADTAVRSRIPLALRFVRGSLRHRPDRLEGSIIQFHRPGTDLAFRSAGHARVRFVHLTTSDLTQPGAESRWRRLGPVLGRLERDSLRRMDRVYVVNATATEAYRRRWPDIAERIRFLPNFYDDTIFRPFGDDERRRLRARIFHALGLPLETRLLLFCGRLDGQKDPGLLIDAFVSVRQTERDAALVILGQGELAGVIRERVRDRGLTAAVHLLGTQPRDRVNEFMNASDMLVLTSRFETGPTVGYEALATGLPIVTTPVGEVAGIVREGDAGRVVAERRPVAVAAAIGDVLRQPIDAMRARARSAAEPFAARVVLEPLYRWHREVTPTG